MRRVVLDPYTDTTPRSAAELLRGGTTTTTTTDEEARLQAAIAMTQLSTAASTLPGGHQVQWRHLAFGDTHREEEQTEEVRQNSQTFDGQMKMAVVVKGASNGAADPETGEIRSAPEVDTSMTVCQAQSGADQRVTGDTCVGNKRTEEGGESLSIFYVEEMSPELGKSSQSGKEIPSEYGVGEEVVIHESDFLEEPFAMGKFIRTAQSSSKSGEAVWTERTPDTNLVGECEDRFTASCEGTPIVKRKTVQALDDAIPSKILRQRKSSKNASLLQATQGVGRGPSKKYRSRTTGKGSQLATGTASQAHYDQAVRGMVFAFNPQGGVFISQAALAPIPMTIVQADRRLLAWLPSNAVSASHGLSLSATTSAFASSAASLPSYAVPQLCDLMPRVTYALPSTLPTSVSYSEDVDAKISSDAAAVTKLSTSKISGKRVKRLSDPSGKSKDARFRTHYSKETFQIRTFQVDEKMEKDETRIREGDEADQSIVGVPVTEFGMDNRIAQRLGIESNQGVDLSMRKSRKRIGDMPMISDTATVDIKTEPKPFTYSNFESCTSPLDLTTHLGSCGSLGTLRNVNTLSGPTTKIEQHDANYGDFENSKDKVPNRISNSGPTDYSLNQVRQDERGLVHSLRHGSRVIVKGTSPVRPTSLMKTEKKSPSAESSGDKYDISQNTICSSLSDSALGSYEGTLNFTNPELQAIRSKHTGSPLLPVSVRNLWPPETRDVANPMALCPSDNGHCEAVTSENTGHSRPGSQCSSDLQLESSRSLEECRLPPKKRRMPFDFQLEAQPSRDDLECANDLSKRSSGEETLEKVNHPEQATSNYQHHPLAVPLPTKYCSGGGSGGGGGFNSGSSGGGSGCGSGGASETSQRIQEPSMRDSMPLTALEIIVKLEFREENNDGRLPSFLPSSLSSFFSSFRPSFRHSSLLTLFRSSPPLPSPDSFLSSALHYLVPSFLPFYFFFLPSCLFNMYSLYVLCPACDMVWLSRLSSGL